MGCTDPSPTQTQEDRYKVFNAPGSLAHQLSSLVLLRRVPFCRAPSAWCSQARGAERRGPRQYHHYTYPQSTFRSSAASYQLMEYLILGEIPFARSTPAANLLDCFLDEVANNKHECLWSFVLLLFADKNIVFRRGMNVCFLFSLFIATSGFRDENEYIHCWDFGFYFLLVFFLNN